MAPFYDTPIVPISNNYNCALSVSKEPDLLDGWWTSETVLALERRAIFSKTWICVTHRSRFTKPGDYISIDLAGFPIFLILGKDNVVRTFHNVCRHRAYTVTKKACGSSLVLGCRYHGWSYDTRGNLVKAPHFDDLEGFDKSQNSLFKIKTCMDRNGFVHVNLNAGRVGEVVDSNPVVDFAREVGIGEGSRFVESLEAEGSFNWKVAACPDAPTLSFTPPPLQTIFPTFLTNLFAVWTSKTPTPPTPLYVTIPPLSTLILLPSTCLFALLTIHPQTPTTTSIHLNLFTTTASHTPRSELVKSVEQDFERYVEALTLKYEEIKFMPLSEDSLKTLPVLKQHLRLEREMGKRVFPASPEGDERSELKVAEKVCKDLESLAVQAQDCVRISRFGSLDW